jgi:hypothetical protein
MRRKKPEKSVRDDTHKPLISYANLAVLIERDHGTCESWRFETAQRMLGG